MRFVIDLVVSRDPLQKLQPAFGTLGWVKRCQVEGSLPPETSVGYAPCVVDGPPELPRPATSKRLPYESPADILKFAKFVIDESLPVRSEKREEVQKMKSPSSFNTHPRITEDA